MHIEYTDTRKSDLKYIILMIALALAIAVCSMSGNIGIKLQDKRICNQNQTAEIVDICAGLDGE